MSDLKPLGSEKLSGDEKLTLDDLYKICESKHEEHVIYSRIIFDFDTLKKSYKVMNLGSPMLDDREKEHILDYVKESAYKLDIPTFISLYNEDGLGNVLKNIEYWLRDNWSIVDRYNKSKHK